MLPRCDRYAVATLILLVICSWAPRFSGPIDLRWDAAVYYILGTALAEGHGYRLLNEPGEIRAILFPPLLPAIVAVHQRVIGTADPVVVGAGLRVFFFLLFAAYVMATYALLRRIARAPYALAGTVVATLTFLPIWLSDRCYSDLPFALTCILFVLLQPRASDGTHAREVLCWATATAALLLRTVGIALFVAWIAESLAMKNYRRAAVRALLALVPMVGWQLYVHQVAAGPEYLSPAYAYQRADYNIYNVTYSQLFSLRDHLNPSLGKATPLERARRLPGLVADLIPGLGGAITVPRTEWELAVEWLKRRPVVKLVPWRTIDVVLTIIGVAILIGGAIQLRAGELRTAVLVLVYVAALCSMPPSYFGELPRYLTVIGPLLMMLALQCFSTLWGFRTRVPDSTATAGTVLIFALALVVLGLGASTIVRGYSDDLRPVVHRNWNGRQVEYRLFTYQDDYEELDQALEWLAGRASPGDVVASTTPHWVYLRTGLKAVLPPFEPDGVTAQALLDSVPVRYVVVADWLSRRHALPAVEHAAGRWRIVYATPHCTIYERLRD
jgi:hypothetical protein